MLLVHIQTHLCVLKDFVVVDVEGWGLLAFFVLGGNIFFCVLNIDFYQQNQSLVLLLLFIYFRILPE